MRDKIQFLSKSSRTWCERTICIFRRSNESVFQKGERKARDIRKTKSMTWSPVSVKGKTVIGHAISSPRPVSARWKRRYVDRPRIGRIRQMKCEARGQRVVDLAGTKAEVEKIEVRFTAGIAARRGSTWRGPPEMTALRQDITASPYRTFLLLSLIGLLLQIHSATGKCLL